MRVRVEAYLCGHSAIVQHHNRHAEFSLVSYFTLAQCSVAAGTSTAADYTLSRALLPQQQAL